MASDLPKVITVNGKRWRLVWLPKGHPMLQGAMGLIESPEKRGRRMFIQMGQAPEELFDSLVHEIAHASGWNLSEEWVTIFASDLTRIIKRLGFEFKALK